ncbi:MAG: DUF1656 domain-containing protein [Acetobacter sp.]|nr:DUF1656 domain-containing protein [Acetobacter sp.]
MLAEFNLFGVFIAPIDIYILAALFVVMFLRSVLWWSGLLDWFWHPALFEVSLYTCVLSLLVFFF